MTRKKLACLTIKKWSQGLGQAVALTMMILALGVAPASAEKADRTKPMVVESDRAEFDEATQTRVLTGKVVITKGTLVIRADKIVIKQDPQGFASLSATGKLASFRQKREGLDQHVEGFAERVDYDEKSETLKLIQRAQLRRLEKEVVADEVLGSQINYDAKTENYTVESGTGAQSSQNPSGRVRIVIQPKAEPANKPVEAKK